MKKLTQLLSISLITLSLSSTIYADNCNAIIQNNSNQPWTFRFSTYYGNVYFSGGVSCPVNGPCVIPPHTTANIEYTHTGGYETGRIYVSDNANWEEKLPYKNTLIWERCPHIDNYDSSDSISRNEPGNGSLTIIKDFWKS